MMGVLLFIVSLSQRIAESNLQKEVGSHAL
jgi:hypothetical protein